VGTVSFSCSKLPVYTSCIFLPNPVSLTANSAASVFVVIQTNAPSLAYLLLPAGLFFAGFLAKRKKWNKHSQVWLGGVLLAVGLCAISGCGSQGNPNEAPLSTPAGGSTFTITATDGTVTQSGNYLLTVQ